MKIGIGDEEKTYDSVGDLFESFEKEDLAWQKRHPTKAAIRDWLDKRFPRGIAGGYRVYYALQEPWKILRHMGYEIKYAWQRVFRGWDDTAVWSICSHLSSLIPQLLEKLKKDKVGIPMFAFEGLPYEDKNTYTYSEESMKIAEARWDKILNDIIAGFENYKKLENEGFDGEKSVKFNKAFDLFRKYYSALWD